MPINLHLPAGRAAAALLPALVALSSSLALTGCDRPSPTPAPVSVVVAASPTASPPPVADKTAPPVTSTATPAPAGAAGGTSLPPSTGSPAPPQPVPAAPATVPAGDFPPEGISRNQWATDRVRAAAAVWGISEAGQAWLESYDFRQMLGQPAWFGSYGYSGWAGAGEAIPRIIVHELSHSYWGAFPVAGRPDLSYDHPAAGPSPALSQYRADLDAFMRQPPDKFEPLRDRFRNMPGLTNGDYSDLFHSGEADIAYFTGGHSALLPPLLLKYYGAYMTPDGVAGQKLADWAGAISWWLGLSGEERRAAGDVFGLQHFPLSAYPLAPTQGAGLRADVPPTLGSEERQRLSDFAAQFDLIKSREFALVDAAGVNRGFSFWRGYLTDMRELHRSHPDVLGNHAAPGAAALGSALDFYISVERLSPQSQAESYRRRGHDPAVRELAVLLKSRAIIELFAGQAPTDGAVAGIEGVIGFYAGQLAATASRVDAVLAAARRSASQGAAELESYMASFTDAEMRSDLGLVFDLMRESDADATGRVLKALSDTALLRMLSLQPAAARSGDVGPARLLPAVGITPGADAAAVTRGAKLLAENSSGNFEIDLPYELAVYDAVERIGASDPAAAVAIIAGSGMRIAPWLSRGSTEMLSILDRAPDQVAVMLLHVTGLHTSPERIIHALTGLDPELAATLTDWMVRMGKADAGKLALLELAHDSYWHGLRAGPGIDPSLDARFIARLSDLRGDEWLMAAAADAVSWLRVSVAAGEVAGDFEAEFRRTLAEATASTPDNGTIALLQRLAALG